MRLCSSARSLFVLVAIGWAKGQGHHKRSIDSLRYTLGSRFGETADHLERCSRLRGQVVYERIGVVKPEDAEELIQTVSIFARTFSAS